VVSVLVLGLLWILLFMKLTFQLTTTSCFVDDDQSSTEVDFIQVC
jgi:hypothetical protein